MSKLGRKRRITSRNQDDLERALAEMKANKIGGTRLKNYHLDLILKHRRADVLFNDSPSSYVLKRAYEESVGLIGEKVANLVKWVPANISVKTLDNYRSVDPLRYRPASVEKALEQFFGTGCTNTDLSKNLPEQIENSTQKHIVRTVDMTLQEIINQRNKKGSR